MIIITDKPGQLCNRLWAYSPFIAFCLKHNRRLRILHFDNYNHYFEDLDRYNNIKIGLFESPKSYRYFHRLIKIFQSFKFQNITSRIQFHLHEKGDKPDLTGYLSKKKSLLISKSWMKFPDQNIMDEYKDEIRKLFKPKQQAVNEVHKVFEQHKHSDTVISGIHIRRGDYKTFMDGRYYFSDEVYLKSMLNLRSQIKKETGKETIFFLSSDSPINTDNFNNLNTFQINSTSAIKDLYALSRCDYITGPPSTFSMWASYYGDVPLRFITSKEDTIQLSDFSPIVAQNRFKNGNIFTHTPIHTEI